ncbi:MAG: BamA/TamA family outer membrane protein [Candidatus Latescibacteria bacterium]|nr:BamA/TamA family outer membrane protein [Candidatus Latescibacterota bacterium]
MKTRNGIVAVWIFALCAALASRAHAADGASVRATRVRVLGAHALPGERAQALLRANGFPAARAVRVLQEAYIAEGYLAASIAVTIEADSSFTVVIDEGERPHIGSARAGGLRARREADVLASLELVGGSPFEPKRLARNIDALLSSYDDEGYPFAQVWIDSLGLSADATHVSISLTVVEGDPRAIDGVVVEGLQKTRPALAQRIAGIEIGVPYRAQTLEDAYLRMVASGVFADVEFPTVRLSSDGRGVDAVITVAEPKRSHTFAAALGYASSDGTDDRVLSGLVQLELNNVGGTLKDFGASWNNDGVGRSQTRIAYRDRLFLGRRLAVGVQLEQVGQDTVYTWQSAALEVERGVGRVAGMLTSVSLGAAGDRNVYSIGDLVNSTRLRVRAGASVLAGSERRAAFARVGVSATLAEKDLSYREGATGLGDVSQWIYEGRLELLVPAFWSLYYGLEGLAQTLESDEATLPLPEQFYVGGARTVRGYREDQFHGRRVGFARNELRLGRTPRDGFYLFVDAGYVLQPTTLADGSPSEDGIGLVGYGFGVRSASPLGRIDLSFAVSDEFSLEQTKVHVLLEQNF